MLSYRVANNDPLGYRVKFDGVEIGSIALRRQHVENRDRWHWGVDSMPLMGHGGRPPYGDADTFEGAKIAFRRAFEEWIARIPVEVWELNRDHIRASDRWRRR
jgi:hypothetical protein